MTMTVTIVLQAGRRDDWVDPIMVLSKAQRTNIFIAKGRHHAERLTMTMTIVQKSEGGHPNDLRRLVVQ
jgi:hypothetical protein